MNTRNIPIVAPVVWTTLGVLFGTFIEANRENAPSAYFLILGAACGASLVSLVAAIIIRGKSESP